MSVELCLAYNCVCIPIHPYDWPWHLPQREEDPRWLQCTLFHNSSPSRSQLLYLIPIGIRTYTWHCVFVTTHLHWVSNVIKILFAKLCKCTQEPIKSSTFVLLMYYMHTSIWGGSVFVHWLPCANGFALYTNSLHSYLMASRLHPFETMLYYFFPIGVEIITEQIKWSILCISTYIRTM